MSRRPRGERANYFISLNDLLIGMVFLMVILVVIVQVAAVERIDELNRKVSRDIEERHALMRRLVEGVRGAVVSKEEGVIRIPAELLFAENDDQPRPAARRILATLATRMQGELRCFGAAARFTKSCDADRETRLEAVYIEGHTDNFLPRGRFETNWQLSSARAISTYQIMRAAAPNLFSIRNAGGSANMVGISAYAHTRPTTPEPKNVDPRKKVDPRSQKYAAWRAGNRRIEFRFLLAAPQVQK